MPRHCGDTALRRLPRPCSLPCADKEVVEVVVWRCGDGCIDWLVGNWLLGDAGVDGADIVLLGNAVSATSTRKSWPPPRVLVFVLAVAAVPDAVLGAALLMKK